MSTTIIGKLSSSSSSPNNSNNNNNNNNNNTNQLFNEENDNISIPTAASNFSTSTTVVSASGTCAESGGEDSLSSSNIVNKPLSLSPTLATTAAAAAATTLSTAAVVASSATTTTTNLPPQSLEQHCRLLEEENQKLKDAQAHLQQQYSEAQRREKILMRKLAHKEQELQDYVSQIAEYKSAQAPGPAALRATLLDPAVNIMFEKLKNELKITKAKLEETQNELSAWKFTPDSNTGKRLMAKCRQLYQENEELGKMMSNGRLAKLEAELATQKKFSEEVKKCQTELDDYLQELDEDVEGMQSTIYFLQQELKATRERIQILEKENNQLKNGETETDPDPDNESSEKLHQQNFILNGKTSGLLRTIGGVDGDGKTTTTTMMTKNELMNETFIDERGEHDERTKKSSFSSSSGSSIHSNMNMNTVIVNTSNIMNSSDSNNSCNNNITNEEIVNIRTARNSSSDIRHNGNNDINCDDSNEIVIKDEGGNGDGDGDSFDCIDDSNNSGTVGCVGGVESGIGSVVSGGGGGGNNNFMMKNTKQPPKKRNYDSDSSENSSTNDITIRNKIVKKKTRRSSVLSIDLNEEDTQIAEEDSEDDDEDEDNNSQRILTRRKSPRSLQSSDHN